MSQKLDSREKQELSAKEKRIKEAVIMHYGKNMQVQEIAEEMGYNRKTIQRYLNSEFASNLKRVYSDQEIYELKAQLETEIRDSKKLAENLISRAIQHEDATPRDLIKASNAIQEIREKHIEMLQELGIELSEEQKAEENNYKKIREELAEMMKEKEENQEEGIDFTVNYDVIDNEEK